MNKRSILGQSLLMMQLASAMMSGESGMGDRNPGPSNEDIELDRMRADERHRKNLLNKGVKEFHINGKTILARSYENALKKANKK